MARSHDVRFVGATGVSLRDLRAIVSGIFTGYPSACRLRSRRRAMCVHYGDPAFSFSFRDSVFDSFGGGFFFSRILFCKLEKRRMCKIERRFKITIRRYRKLLKYVMDYPSINFHVRITPRTRAHVRTLNTTRDLQRRYITWLWKLTPMGYRDYSPPLPER